MFSIGFQEVVDELSERYKGWEGVSQFSGTASRLDSMYKEFCWSPEKIKDQLNIQTRLFDEGYEEEMVCKGIKVVSLCPHHLLPCEFLVDINYKPDGKVLGLSKFTRIAVIMGKRPVMQEMYTRELVEQLYKRINPIWIKVSVTGIHGCMKFRGPLQEVEVETSMIREKSS